MRILVGHNFYQQPGGEDAVFRSEVAMLQKYGHEVYCYERHNDQIKSGLLSRISHAASLRWSKTSYDQMRSLIRSFKPDIAHFHNTFFVMTPSVFYACKDEGVPVVLACIILGLCALMVFFSGMAGLAKIAFMDRACQGSFTAVTVVLRSCPPLPLI